MFLGMPAKETLNAVFLAIVFAMTLTQIGLVTLLAKPEQRIKAGQGDSYLGNT